MFASEKLPIKMWLDDIEDGKIVDKYSAIIIVFLGLVVHISRV